MNAFPEVAMMEAAEYGFNVTQFSTFITDPPSVASDGASCPDGTKEIYFVVSSPNAGVDTFSYAIKSVTDHGKITKVRNSGGTLISPERSIVIGPRTYTAKFPMRFNNQVAFDCQEPTSNNGPEGSSPQDPSPQGPDTFATVSTQGLIYYEAAYKEYYQTSFEDIPETVRRRCTYSYDQPSFRVTRMCAVSGEYTVQATKAETTVRSDDSNILVTDANGCTLADVDVPGVAADSATPLTSIKTFVISAPTNTQYDLDNVTGIDSCTKLYAPNHATLAPPATVPSKPVCPAGYRLMETVTQTSTNGATNEWYVAHIIYNDTTNTTEHAARTSMQRSKGGKAHALGLDSWCVLPGNYSLNLWDYSGLSGASLGWRGGGVFLTDVNDCKVLHATAQGASNTTYYFTVTAGNDLTPAVCPNGTTAYNKSEGWCTYEIGDLSATCNTLDVRSSIITGTSASQRDCNTVWGRSANLFELHRCQVK
jgi:hypothetical protein